MPYQRHDYGSSSGQGVQQQLGFNTGSGYDRRDVMRDSRINPPAGRRGSQWNSQNDRSRSAQTRARKRYQITANEKGQIVTVLACFNAVGTYSPLLFVFKAKRDGDVPC